MKKKRILWLINHTTLRKFEVPLLIQEGYEIFTPKSFPYDEGNLSASVDYQYDEGLSIPKSDLDVLNSANMYEGLSKEVVEIINKHFDMAFFAFFPSQLQELVRKFEGIMVMRPFGLSGNWSYEQIVANELGVSFLKEIEKVRERFWFGQGYEHLRNAERGIFKHRAITLPVGLNNATINDEWVGNKERIYFVCPRISTSSYYRNYYEAFKDQFDGKYDYVIGGAQPLPVKDTKVLGYLNDVDFKKVFTESRMMFYHSQDRNHLHYHPFEAVKVGLPLVFMANGMLDELGYADLPGCAKDQVDMHKKVDRLMRNDRGYISEVRKSQPVLLDVVKRESCLPVWQQSLRIIESEATKLNQLPVVFKKQKKKMLFCLPIEYGGGTFSSSKQLVKMFALSFSEIWDIEFAHLKSTRYNEGTLEDLHKMQIKTFEFKWETRNSSEVEDVCNIMSLPYTHINDEYIIMTNDGGMIDNYDHIIFTTDRPPGSLFSLIPYSVVVQDVLQRYVPQFFNQYYEHELITNVRGAQLVFCTTPQTMIDVIDYMGVKNDKVVLLPLTFDNELKPKEGKEKSKPNRKYFIWPTNLAIHKNHQKMFMALDYYWNELGGNYDCYITGVETEKLATKYEKSDKSYLASNAKTIRSSSVLKKRIKIKGELPKQDYANLLKDAEFMVHPVIADNGTFCVIEAAEMGVPSLSNDYPQMRYIDNLFGLGMRFTNANNYVDLAKNIKGMEDAKTEWQNIFSNKLNVQKRTWNIAWEELRAALFKHFGQ